MYRSSQRTHNQAETNEKTRPTTNSGISAADIPLFAVGLLFAFISAWLCVRWLLKYIATHNFVPFAWYRIAFGVVVLATAWSGLVVWAD